VPAQAHAPGSGKVAILRFAPAPPFIAMINATIANFETEVIEASMQIPVLVDFWAPWCGPCKVIGPILEKLETEYAGRFKLVKIDSDQEQQLAQAFGVRSIPTCVLLQNGQPVDGFTGALPEGQIKAFLLKNMLGEESAEELSQIESDQNAQVADTLLTLTPAIDKHIHSLLKRKRQLVYKDPYGKIVFDKFLTELDYFIDNILSDELSRLNPSTLTNEVATELPGFILERLHQYENSAPSNSTKLVDDMDGLEYEQFCANLLEKFGWETSLTKASGDQGADILGRMNGTSVAFQCKKMKEPVGNAAIQQARAAQSFYQTDESAVISFSPFTPSAVHLAETTGTYLLSHEDLPRFLNDEAGEELTSPIDEEIFYGQAAEKIARENRLQECVLTVKNAPEDDDARFDLVKLLLQMDRDDDAKVAFAPVIAKAAGVRRLDSLQRWMSARDAQVDASTQVDELQARIAANKRDFEARFALAQQHMAHNRWTEAMDELLDILMRDKSWSDDLARKTYIAILDVIDPPKPKVAEGQIPPEDPTVVTYRRRLSSVVLS
jgi:thioredoxin